MSYYRGKRKSKVDDFIDDEEAETESSEEEAPKKSRQVVKEKSRTRVKEEPKDEEAFSEEETPRKSNKASDKSRPVAKPASKVDPQAGITACKLSKNRKVVVRQFKHVILVDIREYYGDEEKPGKKGIALSLDQWKMLSENASKVNEAIAEIS